VVPDAAEPVRQHSPGGQPPQPPRRDRDAAGRARNARPRDGLGRPLSRGAAGVPQVPDEQDLTPAQVLSFAQELIDAAMPFHAHEVLEAEWKRTEPAERDLWQGLAQIAVGLTHGLRGNAHGAAALLRRGSARLAAYQPAGPHGVDVAGLSARCAELADRIEGAGLASLDRAELQVTLSLPAPPSAQPD
jgi:uncharacterized protein